MKSLKNDTSQLTTPSPPLHRIMESIADASKANSTSIETHGPITTKYIYFIMYNISSIPSPKVWSLITAQYMTDFFNSAGYRVVDAQVTIEFISQLDTGGQTEVLYIQQSLYTTDSSSKYVDFEEILVGPFYNKKDREKYVNILKEVDSIGYRNLIDTSIPENLGELDFTPRISSINEEGTNDSAVYLFLIGLGGFVLLLCACACFLCLGLWGWFTLSNLEPMDDELDEDESTFDYKDTENFRDVVHEDSYVEDDADRYDFQFGTKNLRLRSRLT